MAVDLVATDGDGNDVSSFAQPYTLTVVYDPALLATAGITDENKLLWLKRGQDAWVQPGCVCTVDAANNKFTVSSDNFSEYALFGVRAVGATHVYLPTVQK
jgi:hypothetical protein